MHNFPLHFTIYRRQGRFNGKYFIISCPLLQMYLVYYTKENVLLPTSLFTLFYTKQILELKIQQTHIKEIFEAYITFKIYVSTKRFSLQKLYRLFGPSIPKPASLLNH